jgi:hypothetical protein
VEDIDIMSLIQSPVNLPMVKIWWARCNSLRVAWALCKPCPYHMF